MERFSKFRNAKKPLSKYIVARDNRNRKVRPKRIKRITILFILDHRTNNSCFYIEEFNKLLQA